MGAKPRAKPQATQQSWAMLGASLEHASPEKFQEVHEIVADIVEARWTLRTAHIRTRPYRPGEVPPHPLLTRASAGGREP